MKLKTAVISVVVSAALVAGAGYGAYYALQGNKSPVEVVPVSNVNTGYWGGMSESIFGSVTSQVAQTVQLNEEYSIDKVYVKAGDEVREGDPLFSYDMTLQELELEMGRISLQTQELTMTKLEKDLEKLKKTTATASLEGHDRTMTAVSQEDTVIDEPSGDFSQNNTGNTEQADDIPGNAGTDNTAGTAGSGTPGGSGDSGASGAGENVGGEAGLGGIQIEDVQEMTASSDHTDQELTIVDSVVRYEQLVLVIDSLFRSYGDELRTDEIGSAVEDAVTYYRKNLAEEKVSSVVNEDGSSAEVREYVVKDEVRAALGEEEAAKLEVFSQKLEEYQLVYVEMLIQETVRETAADSSELSGALEKIQDSYDLLSEKQQQRVENVDAWRVLKEKVQEMPQNEERPEAGEDETSQETQQGESQPEAGAGETSQEIQQGESQPEAGAGETSQEIQQSESQLEAGAGETAQETQQSEGQPEAGEGEISQEIQQSEGQTGIGQELLEAGNGQTDEETSETTEDNLYDAGILESETETGTEASEYTVTVIDPARSPEPSVLSYAAGDTVLLDAVTNDPTRTFEKWEPEFSEWENVEEWEALADWNGPHVDFSMPARNLTVKAVYTDNMAQIDDYIYTFVGMAETVLSEGAAEALAAQNKDFATELESAVIFYQQWLAELPEEILDTTFAEAKMSQYRLRQNIEQYLNENNRAFMIQQMNDYYKQLCIKYVRASFDKLNPQALVRADLEKAARVYAILGDEWRMELEQQWQEEQMAKAEMTGVSGSAGEEQEGESEGEGQGMQQSAPMAASIGDLLAVYNVYLLFQEYQQMNPNETEENRFAALQNIQQEYLKLTDEQKMLVAQNTELVNVLSQYGLWEAPEAETEMDFGDFGGYDDFGFSDGVGYTASELKEMIEEKEHDIKMCALDIRELELEVKKQQRIVDGKVVRSTLDGTVVSIGTEDGDSEDDYFVKVTNQTGLYAKGSMNELSLEKIHVGDTISGMMTNTGMSFTAVIKEISEYPDPNGNSMSWGSENTNASYYPFYAEIENTEDIEEGEAEIQLSDTLSTSMDGIYLEKYFVRTESDGKPYVFMQGQDGKLKKQYITTGKTIYSYAIEIVSGLEPTDKIAFPYGKNVQEGAETKEVDMLTDAYM